MANYDVIVDITDQSAQISTIDFGLTLIVSTDVNKDYKEYDISAGIANSGIVDDYAETTEAYQKAATFAAQSPRPSKIAIIGCGAGETLTTRLNNLLVENGEFFRVLISTNNPAQKLELAKWAAANKKFAYLQYDTTTFIEDYSSVARTRLLLNKNTDEHLDAAEAGYFSAIVPGTASFKFRTYNAVTPSKLTPDEINQAETKNMGYYIRNVGIDMQRNSKAANYTNSRPAFMDDIESRVYTETQIANNLLTQLVNLPKLTGDTRGLQLIDSTIGKVLLDNYNLGIIAVDDNGKPDFQIDTSKATFDSAERAWKDISFIYRYAHPTAKIYVSGIVR